MKKVFALVTAAVLTLSLAACMPLTSTTDSSTEEPMIGGGTSIFSPGSDTQDNQDTTLTVALEGETQEVAATLYQGAGYAIAIPTENWIKDDDEPEWEPKNTDGVSLTIRLYSTKKAADAEKILIADEDDYAFGEAETLTLDSGVVTECITGTQTDDGMEETMVAYFAEVSGACYAMILEYPTEATEGYGSWLAAMANTFTLTENK